MKLAESRTSCFSSVASRVGQWAAEIEISLPNDAHLFAVNENPVGFKCIHIARISNQS
jgi:hypothetical protein